MRCLDRCQLINLVELIYRVQEAYYHEWDVANEDSGTSKKDVQIVQQVLEACAKELKIDTVRHNSLHFLHVNVIWQLMEDTQ